MAAVSICLPVFNGEKYLAQAIESALAQTYEDFELLISDDCSTDDTPAIVEHFKKQDKRIKSWKNEQNLKLFANYNACIERSSGKYIKPFAHDDLFHPDLLKRMVYILDENTDISLVTSARSWIDAEGQRIEAESQTANRIMKPYPRDTRVPSKEAITQTLEEVTNWLGEPCSQMFRREHADHGYDTSFRQVGDLEYSYRLLQNGDYYFLADDLCSFRLHAESWSTARKLDITAYLDWFLLASKYRRYLSADLKIEEHCLNIIFKLTQNLEHELNEAKRLGLDKRGSVLLELCDLSDPLSFYECEKGAPRDFPTEFKGLGAIAFLHSALIENELRLAHAAVASPDITASSSQALANRRPELAVAIDALKQTLMEKDKEIQALRQTLTEMGSSMSWRVTAPLRKFKSGLS